MKKQIEKLIADYKLQLVNYEKLIAAANARKKKFRNALTSVEAYSYSDACIDRRIASAQRQRTIQFISDLEDLEPIA